MHRRKYGNLATNRADHIFNTPSTAFYRTENRLDGLDGRLERSTKKIERRSSRMFLRFAILVRTLER